MAPDSMRLKQRLFIAHDLPESKLQRHACVQNGQLLRETLQYM